MSVETTANPTPAATAEPPAADATAKPAVGGKAAAVGEKRKRGAPAEGGKAKPKGRKRGPPRPHRKLEEEVLASRMERLEARIGKARDQLEDAERHLEIYALERKYRKQDAAAEAAELDALERRSRGKDAAAEAPAKAEEAV
jgi:hypothetical protein